MRISSLLLLSAVALLASLRPVSAQSDTTTSTGFTKNHYAAAKEDPKRFTVNPASVRIVMLGEVDVEDAASYVKLNEPARPLEGAMNAIDSLVNVAKKAWALVQNNKPVYNVSSQYAVAYPEGVTAAAQLAGWSKPKGYRYGFYAENMYGGVMINSEYKVLFTYGGTYKGKGRFITAATVIPTVADVAWGYTFTMNAAVPDTTITNVGTAADPVAAMQLKVSWKMSTVLKESNGTSVYYMEGNGYYQEIASPWKDGRYEMPAIAPLHSMPAPVAELQPLPFGLTPEAKIW